MASDTPPQVQGLVVYQVFPRNHGPNGRLSDVTADLDRIAALGVDVVYLLPIHPIGEEARKGSLGSPFAIRDYRAIHPDLGNEADFAELVDQAHARGLRVIIDVVFNHTAPDSLLLAEHPDFFRRDATGRPVGSVPEWSDIVDFHHPNPAVEEVLLDTLRDWVRRGVDGFRCDAATLVPLAFWLRARRELAELKPGLLWIAETVHPFLIESRRAEGSPLPSDAEMFQAFDIEYTYDVWGIWQAVVTGRAPVGRYLEMLRWQEVALPANFAKLRHVENHDNFRIMRFAPSRRQALAWTALAAFCHGPFMVFAGQESAARRWPSLFEPDPIDWGEYELTGFITTLARLKKHPAMAEAAFLVLTDEPCVQFAWGRPVQGVLRPPPSGRGLYGIFNVAAAAGPVEVQLPDGEYRDLLEGGTVVVSDGTTAAPVSAVVVEVTEPFAVRRWHAPLMDLFLHVETLGDD